MQQQQLPQNYDATFLYPVARRRGIAKTQQRDYGGKPWAVGLPTHDILGNALCFNDQPGNLASRYWVVGTTPSGAHIRKNCVGDLTAYAPTEAEALEIGTAYAARIGGRVYQPSTARPAGEVFIIEFRGSARSLD
jgi:hypothetical protein